MGNATFVALYLKKPKYRTIIETPQHDLKNTNFIQGTKKG